MAYRPDDLYNTGINTIGTDLGLGNIQGQNIQVADASIEALLNKERERIGLGPTKVKETFPRFLADEYGTYKSYMGGPGATQLIVDEYQGTFPDLLNVPIKDLQERFDIGLENPDLMQVKKDDYETPYDFSNIEGHLASRDQSFVPRSNIVSRFRQHQLMNQRKQDMQQRIRQAEAAETDRIAKEKADAAAQAQASQRQADQARISRAYREETGGQAGSYAPGGGSGAHAADASGSTYSDPFDPGGGEAQGGFIDGTNRRRSYFNGGLASLWLR